MNKRISLTIAFLVLYFCAFSQLDFNISGKIVDSKSKKGIPFAYVRLDGYSIGTVSDENGFFKVKIEEKYSKTNIVFSYLGYKNHQLSVLEASKNQNQIIKLVQTTSELEEIVVKAEKMPS